MEKNLISLLAGENNSSHISKKVVCVRYGANRLKRVPLVLQNVMLYVIRVRIPNSIKMISQGLLFKSQDQFIIFAYFVKFLQAILQ